MLENIVCHFGEKLTVFSECYTGGKCFMQCFMNAFFYPSIIIKKNDKKGKEGNGLKWFLFLLLIFSNHNYAGLFCQVF